MTSIVQYQKLMDRNLVPKDCWHHATERLCCRAGWKRENGRSSWALRRGKIFKLLEDKESQNTEKATKGSRSILKAYLQEKKNIPDPATAEDLERFYENSMSQKWCNKFRICDNWKDFEIFKNIHKNAHYKTFVNEFYFFVACVRVYFNN